MRRIIPFIVLLGFAATACAGGGRTHMEIRAGGQFARLGDIETYDRDGRINLENQDLAGRALVDFRVDADQFSGRKLDLSAVLNACEAQARLCQMVVYDDKSRSLALWDMATVAVSEETRRMIQGTNLSRARQVLSGEPEPLSIGFDVITLLPPPPPAPVPDDAGPLVDDIASADEPRRFLFGE